MKVSEVEFIPFTSAMEQPKPFAWLWKLFKKTDKKEEPKEEFDPATFNPCNPEKKLLEYQSIFPEANTIVVFRNGTAVYSSDEIDIENVFELMSQEGGVVPGTPKADFAVARISEPIPGTVVKYHHPNIISFVSAAEMEVDAPEHVPGYFLRAARDCDSLDLMIVSGRIGNETITRRS
ncbi:MAG: hypothetical protein ACSHYA_20340 [Opitutaceae bacterium]